MTTTRLKKKLLKEGILKNICSSCNNTLWLNNPIPLELHHIDGNPKNNDLQNLKLLCPNCHSFTDNHKGKNKKRKERIIVSDDQLIECIKSSFTKREALLKAGLIGYGSSYTRINNIIEKYNINLLTRIRSQKETEANLKRIETIRKRYGTIYFNPYKTKIEWPSKEVLEQLIIEKPLTQIAKQLGVSDNSIRKVAKKYGIDIRHISIWSKRHSPVLNKK